MKVYLHDVMLRRAEGADPSTLTPREWQTRYGPEVAERRSYVLAMIAAHLGARARRQPPPAHRPPTLTTGVAGADVA
jgi:hypothetical protein